MDLQTQTNSRSTEQVFRKSKLLESAYKKDMSLGENMNVQQNHQYLFQNIPAPSKEEVSSGVFPWYIFFLSRGATSTLSLQTRKGLVAGPHVYSHLKLMVRADNRGNRYTPTQDWFHQKVKKLTVVSRHSLLDILSAAWGENIQTLYRWNQRMERKGLFCILLF